MLPQLPIKEKGHKTQCFSCIMLRMMMNNSTLDLSPCMTHLRRRSMLLHTRSVEPREGWTRYSILAMIAPRTGFGNLDLDMAISRTVEIRSSGCCHLRKNNLIFYQTQSQLTISKFHYRHICKECLYFIKLNPQSTPSQLHLFARRSFYFLKLNRQSTSIQVSSTEFWWNLVRGGLWAKLWLNTWFFSSKMATKHM